MMTSDVRAAGHGEHIRGLDGLRAVAILAVMILHFVGQTTFPIEQYPLVEPFVRFGWAGVDLFFAISGFLITTLMLREERSAPQHRFSLRRFYARRALRILPAFWVSLLLGFFVWSRFEDVACATSLARMIELAPSAPWHLVTLTSNYAIVLGSVPVAIGGAYVVLWSLCIEEHFYVVWSVFMRFQRSARGRILVAAALCAASVVLRYATALSWPRQVAWLKMVTHLRLDAILVGALAALTLGWLQQYVRGLRAAGLAASSVVAAFLFSGHLYERDLGVWGFTIGYAAVAVACAWVVVEVAFNPSSAAVRALESRPMRFVGRVSFAAYLLNVPMIDLAFAAVARVYPPGDSPALHLLLTLPLVLGMVLGVAWVLHVVVERPAMRLRRFFPPLGTAEPPGAPNPAAAR